MLLVELAVLLDTNIPNSRNMERYRDDISAIPMILNQSPESNLTISEETIIIIRLTKNPTNNGIPKVKTAPKYLPRRTLYLGIGSDSIRRSVPACLSPQKLS